MGHLALGKERNPDEHLPVAVLVGHELGHYRIAEYLISGAGITALGTRGGDAPYVRLNHHLLLNIFLLISKSLLTPRAPFLPFAKVARGASTQS